MSDRPVVLRHHLLVHVSGIEPKHVLSGPMHCKNHSSKDQENCFCTVCAVTKHRAHGIDNIEDAIARSKNEVQNGIAEKRRNL